MVPLKESADKKKMEGKGTASRKEAQQAEAAKKELRPCNQHVAVCFCALSVRLPQFGRVFMCGSQMFQI